MRANLQRKASADFLRRYRDGGGGLYLGPMYDHTGQPPNEHDEHEVGKVTIHCPIIAVLSPRKSSNHAVRLEAPRR